MELYPGITLQQHGERYSINLEVMTNHGKGLVSFDLVKQIPEIQEAINKRCADILITPIIDWKTECEHLNTRIGILESEIKAKQMTIDAMNTNYELQQKRIIELQEQVKELRDTPKPSQSTANAIFKWLRR